jgi:acyl-CoA thioesterase FadM
MNVSFSLTLPTRHTDTFAATGFVHAGVLLALTELAYAASEQRAGISKPVSIVAVEARTRAEYLRPLPWQDGAQIEVECAAVSSEGLTQRYLVRSARSTRLIARIEHDWVWLDTASGHGVALSEDVQARFAALSADADADA